MTRRVLSVLFLISCLLFSCKKEQPKAKQGKVEFDVDSVHYAFTPSYALLDTTHTSHREFQIGSSVEVYSLIIAVYSDSLANSGLLQPITYTGANLDLVYYDGSHCQYESWGDTFNIQSLTITSCAGDPPVLNAVFQAKFNNGFGNMPCLDQKLITNGKITDVVYDIVQ